MRTFAARFFLGGMVSTVAWSAPTSAQQVNPPAPPVLTPRVTVFGTVRDSSADGALLPNAAAVSPNGKLIAYCTKRDVRMITAGAATHRVIFDGTVHVLRWGDKGDAVTLTYDDPRTGLRDVYVLHVDPNTGIPTGPAVKAAGDPVNHGAFLSPDESLVAYARPVWDSTRKEWSDTRADLAVAPANGGPIRILATAQDLRVGGWSPDGRTLYFNGFPDSTSKKNERRRISVDGGTSTSLGEVSGLPWPNATDPVTRQITAIFGVPKGVSITDWSSRNPIAGVRVTRTRGVRIINLVSGFTSVPTDITGEVEAPVWFSGGTKLAFVERRDSALSLVTMNADGSSRRTQAFTTPPRFGASGLQVSPDGKSVAFLGESRQTLEFMDLGSGVQRRLREVAADAAAPQGIGLGQLLWNADSRSIRYVQGTSDAPRRAVREVTLAGEDRLVLPIATAAARSGAGLTARKTALPDGMSADVMLFDLEKGVEVASYSGGPPRSIYKGRIRYASSLSPDGRIFAARDPDHDPAHEVMLVSMNDGSSRVLRHSFIQVPGMLWHPDGKQLLLMGHETPDGPVQLYSVPIDGSAPRAIALVGSNQDDISVALSPDGLRVAVAVPSAKTATLLRLDYNLPTERSQR